MSLFICVFDMFLCIARNSVSGSFSKGRWEAFQNFGRIYTPVRSISAIVFKFTSYIINDYTHHFVKVLRNLLNTF